MESQELLFRIGVSCLNDGGHSPTFGHQLVREVKGELKLGRGWRIVSLKIKKEKKKKTWRRKSMVANAAKHRLRCVRTLIRG